MGTCEWGEPAFVELNGKPFCKPHYERELDRHAAILRNLRQLLQEPR